VIASAAAWHEPTAGFGSGPLRDRADRSRKAAIAETLAESVRGHHLSNLDAEVCTMVCM